MNFQYPDLLAILGYLTIVTAIGLYAGRSRDSKDFFLGGKSLHWTAIMLSIIATETSSLTFLNVPGISYYEDYAFLQLAFGFILGRVVVSILILPMYYKSGYTSIYEWIGEKFGKSSQKYTSAIFLITRVLSDGVRLYATSIPVALILSSILDNKFSDFQISILTLFLITFITLLYTVYGGFRSVVFTDVIQFIVYIGGGVFSLVYIYSNLNPNLNISQIYHKLSESGKLTIFRGFQGEFFTSTYYFVNAIFAGILISIGSHGVDQMFAQRLLACNTERESRLALIGSGILVFFQFLLFLMIGSLLFIHYGNSTENQTKVFSMYIIQNIPSPILGLLVAAVLASAMSTLSSSINSMSLSFLIDFRGQDSNSNTLAQSKYTSFLWGIVLFLSSLLPYYLSERYQGGLVDLGLRITSFTFGPMIGIFLLGKWKRELIVSPVYLNSSIAISIFFTMCISYFFTVALFFLIPIGMTIFFVLIFLFHVNQFDSNDFY